MAVSKNAKKLSKQKKNITNHKKNQGNMTQQWNKDKFAETKLKETEIY